MPRLNMTKTKWPPVLWMSFCCAQGLAAEPVPAPQADPASTLQERIRQWGRVSPKQRAALAQIDKSETNARAASGFLLANKARSGVITLTSGLQYRVVKAGNGKRPSDSNSVRCRYRGTLIDGSSFDIADDQAPVVLKVTGLIPGLKEAVKLMPAGSVWEVVVPPHLAYGDKGNGAVAPNTVLIYSIEILAVL